MERSLDKQCVGDGLDGMNDGSILKYISAGVGASEIVDILRADGVVVVPPPLVEGLVAYGIEHEVQERFARLKLEEGPALHEAYPPNAELRPLYLEWRKSQPEYEQYPFAFANE